MISLVARAYALAALLAFGIATAAPQTASVEGTAKSAAGTPISNATIELENTATSARLRVTTDSSGRYVFQNVPAGTYRMMTSTPTLTGTTSDPIVIDGTQSKTVNITLQNPTATAPTSTALITVDKPEPVQGLDSPQIRTSWNSRDIGYLPSTNIIQRTGELYGAYNLSLLGAGVANRWGIGPGRGPIVGGQRPLSNDFLIEGVDNNNRALPGPLVSVAPEATSEFVSYQNQFPPEYGHSAGGQFNSILRTGTNQFHGALYEYLQNRNLNAEDPSLRARGIPGFSRYDQNRLGGNAGFPIIKDNLFFFGNFEYVPLGTTSTPSGTILAPTAAGYQALAGLRGVSANNLAIARQYLTAGATSSGGAGTSLVNGVSIPLGVVSTGNSVYQNQYNGVGSVDWKIGNSDSLRARYVQNEMYSNGIGNTLPAFATPMQNRALVGTVSEYHNLGSRGINELRLSYSRYLNRFDNTTLSYPGLSSFPNLTILELNSQVGQGINLSTRGINNYQLADNVNWTLGRHTLRFGYDGRRTVGSILYPANGAFTYSTLQGFLFDQRPDVYAAQSFGNTSYSTNQWNHYGYVNDSFRMSPNVQVNLGVRYEYITIPAGIQAHGANLGITVPGLISFNRPSIQRTGFAPRVGLAWAPTGVRNTVVRAGFGMNYDALAYSAILTSVPPGATTLFANSTNSSTNFLGAGGIRNPFAGVSNPTTAQMQAMTSTYFGDQRLPYTMQWDLGVQQTVLNRFILDVKYLGVKGVHIPVQGLLNRSAAVTEARNLPLFYSQPSQAQLNALPLTLTQLQSSPSNAFTSAGFTNPIATVRPDGFSWYNGLLVGATQRFSGGFQMKANYTWSHLIDNVSGLSYANTGALGIFNAASPRGSSIYDHRHVGSLTALWDVGGIGTKSYGWVREALANMTVAGTFVYQSPARIPITSGINSGLAAGANASGVFVNPNGLAGTASSVTPLTNASGQTVAYLANNPNAQFIQAGAGTFPTGGTAYYPDMRPINNFDAAAFKRFAVRDRFSVEVHGEAFNVLNHAQYVPGNLTTLGVGNLQSFNFLVPGSRAFGDASQAFSSHPRTLQVGLRFLW